MAVADKTASQLRLALFEGNDELTGKPKYKYKSINNIKTDATTDQLYHTANALGTLYALPVHNVERTDRFMLSE